MFKKSNGFNLLKKHQDEKAKLKQEGHSSLNYAIKLAFVLIVTIFLWAVPPAWIGMPDLTLVQQRMIAIFIFAALMWVMEIIPAWATSVSVVVIMLLAVSDSSIKMLIPADEGCKTVEIKSSKGQMIGYVSTDAKYAFRVPKELKAYYSAGDSLNPIAMKALPDTVISNPVTHEVESCTVVKANMPVVLAGPKGKYALFEENPVKIEQRLGTTVSYKNILSCFADPIIMLFIGGFILAIAATKSGLDVVLAKALLKPFGCKPHFVLLGFLMVTALFSMFISNTATAAMMLMFLTPVLKALPADGKGKVALALAIPIGANVGGMGTPVGTPPNAIALKWIQDGLHMNIGFGEWMSFMTPYMLIILLFAWLLLIRLYPFKQKEIILDIQDTKKKNWRDYVVYVTFAITVLLWMFDKATGINANVVAMVPVGVFCVLGIITAHDLEEINWSVLWMVAGGFALGVGLQDTGLAEHLLSSIPFGEWSPILIIVGSGLICWGLSTFISNTATAALLMPIMAVVAKGMGDKLGSIGGGITLLMGIAISASLAMSLPISTPPNALAHATGMIKQKQMVITGVIIGIVGLAIGYVMLIVLGKSGFFAQY